MTTGWSILISVTVSALIIGGWVVWLYNRFVHGQALVQEAWSGIDVQLKRRSDLIPNLVKIVRAYAAHEREVLEEVVRLRGCATEVAAEDLPARQVGENAFSQQLRRLLVVVEAYPDLKADRNYRDLQNQLVDVEEQIQYARRYYNGTVRDYNVAIASFPGNLLARWCSFKLFEFFQLETATERKAPEVVIA